MLCENSSLFLCFFFFFCFLEHKKSFLKILIKYSLRISLKWFADFSSCSYSLFFHQKIFSQRIFLWKFSNPKYSPSKKNFLAVSLKKILNEAQNVLSSPQTDQWYCVLSLPSFSFYQNFLFLFPLLCWYSRTRLNKNVSKK